MLETPPFFTGVTMDTKAVGQSIAAPFDNNPKTDGWEFLSFPLYIIDLPFSLVADVAYIPADYKYHKRKMSQQGGPGYRRQGAPQPDP